MAIRLCQACCAPAGAAPLLAVAPATWLEASAATRGAGVLTFTKARLKQGHAAPDRDAVDRAAVSGVGLSSNRIAGWPYMLNDLRRCFWIRA